MAIQRIRAFFNLEASGGIVLALAAIAAMIIANTPLSTWYESFIHAPVAIQIGGFAIAKDAHHWINDLNGDGRVNKRLIPSTKRRVGNNHCRDSCQR